MDGWLQSSRCLQPPYDCQHHKGACHVDARIYQATRKNKCSGFALRRCAKHCVFACRPAAQEVAGQPGNMRHQATSGAFPRTEPASRPRQMQTTAQETRRHTVKAAVLCSEQHSANLRHTGLQAYRRTQTVLHSRNLYKRSKKSPHKAGTVQKRGRAAVS